MRGQAAVLGPLTAGRKPDALDAAVNIARGVISTVEHLARRAHIICIEKQGAGLRWSAQKHSGESGIIQTSHSILPRNHGRTVDSTVGTGARCEKYDAKPAAA